jgi:sulfur-carrier protein
MNPALPVDDTPRILVLFFGPLGELMGRERWVELPAAGCTIADLRQGLAELAGGGGAGLMRPDVRAAIDQTVVSDGARVRPGQEVAFLSIFSGG